MDIPILSMIFKARDKPSDYYSGSNYTFLFGATTSGKSVNEFTAMQTTAVYSCVRILSEALASLPLHIYRYKSNGKERVYDHPLYHILHDEPNSETTSFVFRETLTSVKRQIISTSNVKLKLLKTVAIHQNKSITSFYL